MNKIHSIFAFNKSINFSVKYCTIYYTHLLIDSNLSQKHFNVHATQFAWLSLELPSVTYTGLCNRQHMLREKARSSFAWDIYI